MSSFGVTITGSSYPNAQQTRRSDFSCSPLLMWVQVSNSQRRQCSRCKGGRQPPNCPADEIASGSPHGMRISSGLFHPGGIPACSRWLSVATPPDESRKRSRTPAGVPPADEWWGADHSYCQPSPGMLHLCRESDLPPAPCPPPRPRPNGRVELAAWKSASHPVRAERNGKAAEPTPEPPVP